ncbi:MAG TPA: glutamate 5-kinase [Candidatus Omnitrophica bacterium]|nr:glutamate 5-kinase [Candidatus Omnitrophota bacterium]
MQYVKNYKRIVVKIGSSILSKENKLDGSSLKSLVSQVCLLLDKGIEVIIVSSGAVSSGLNWMNLKSRPNKIDYLQACASVGQAILMQSYINAFLCENRHCGQLLLTWDDFNDRGRYLNAKNTILALLRYKTIPIINENDTVSTQELKFGDNDNLSSLVAMMVKADLLINLSDVDGLFDRSGTKLSMVSTVTPQIKKLACPTKKSICRGGMITKLEAAEKLTKSGIPYIIANGRVVDILIQIVLERKMLGTSFLPIVDKSRSKKIWIAYSAKPKGKIFIDSGAHDALVKRNKSLLSVGIFKVEGKFDKGDIVSILDKEGCEFARGAVTCSAQDLESIKGKKQKREIVHRNNLAII